MNYILMHKNVPVAELELTDDGQIVSVLEVFHKEHAPIGVNLKQIRSLVMVRDNYIILFCRVNELLTKKNLI